MQQDDQGMGLGCALGLRHFNQDVTAPEIDVLGQALGYDTQTKQGAEYYIYIKLLHNDFSFG